MARADDALRRAVPISGAAVRGGLLLSALLLTLSGCAQDPSAPGIFVSDLGATAPRKIAAAEGQPVWSPTGEAVAWGNEDGLFVRDLAVTAGSTRRLTDDAVAGVPAWSPDGSSITFTTREGMLTQIAMPSGEPGHSVPIQAVDAARPPVAVLAMGGPAWSPDGETIAYTCWDGAGDEICLVSAAEGAPRQLTRIDGQSPNGAGVAQGARAAANVGPASWSPDGQRLAAAVYGDRRGAPNGVFVIDPAAGSADKVSDLVPNSPVLWTAEGDALVFSATRDGRSDAYRVRLESGEAEVLTSGLAQGARNPALDPAGSRLAVESDGRITVLDLSRQDTAPVEIETTGNDVLPAWNSDGTALAFAAIPDPITSYP